MTEQQVIQAKKAEVYDLLKEMTGLEARLQGIRKAISERSEEIQRLEAEEPEEGMDA